MTMADRELVRRAEQRKAEVSRVIGELSDALNASSARLNRGGDPQCLSLGPTESQLHSVPKTFMKLTCFRG